MKNRLVRVNELIKRELGELIRREIAFTQLVTVQDVDITPDLKHAHVFISVLGDDPNGAMTLLHDRRKELQSLLARRVILKYTPQLHFKLDDTVARGSRVIDILQSLDIPEETPEEAAARRAAQDAEDGEGFEDGFEDDERR